MNVVQALGWYYPDSIGGTEVYVAALSRHLRSFGHTVTVAAPRAGAAASAAYDHDGVAVFRYPIPAEPTRGEAQGRAPVRGASAFHHWLAASRPDIVHFHTFVTGLGLFEIEAARAAGARVIVTTHASSLGFICQRGTLMEHGESMCDGRLDVVRCAACDLEARGLDGVTASIAARLPVAVSAAAGRLAGRAGTMLGMPDLIAWNRTRQTRMLALVDAFVVLTDRAAGIVLANGAPPARIVVNRLGVSQDGPRPNRGARAGGAVLRVGYVGRFDPIKGVVDLARAIAAVPRELPLAFEFRGPINGARDQAIVHEVRRLCGDDRRVRIADAVASDAVPDIMAGYDVACYPSRCLEGGPTAGLEAIAAGTPAIGVDAGGLAEVIVDGVSGRLIRAGDTAALLDVLVEIGRTPELVDGWRRHLPPVRTMADVARDYQTLYAA